jgi:hypothetical protein|uniref:Gfo/Idh/MocA family protein n=1 Tax=Cephaloticoccus sp. TaxID=1985742 RepID=UPI00404B4448
MSAPTTLRIAMLGMIPGNGHPYSWSAIVNSFDRAAMSRCPYSAILNYLGPLKEADVCIPGAQVTHIWTDKPEEAPEVAAASLIPNIVAKPEDVIGHVDAVMISTDDGFDHVRRARPFIEAGLPVFIDKPLATSIEELNTFIGWHKAGAKFLSSSGMRYAPALDPLLADPTALGDLRWISSTSAKAWENYGIHALEPVFCLLGPGFESARLESRPGLEVAHLQHTSGAQVNLPLIYDGGASFGRMQICGTGGVANLHLNDTYTAFRRQMLAFIDFARTGKAAYPFADTVEMMCVLIAGLKSRAEGGRRVTIAEIKTTLI